MELYSARLCLRRLRPADTVALCAYRSLPEVARFQSWVSFGQEDAARLMAAQAQADENTPGTWVQLALTLRESGEVVGDCGIHFCNNEHKQVELGITLAPAHQGRGFATEGLASVLDYLFSSLGKHRAYASVDAENHAASHLFRRLGFRQESHFVENVWFKGAWGSEFLFALLRSEWPGSSADIEFRRRR